MDDRCRRGPVTIELHRIDADHEHEIAAGDPLVQPRRAEALDRPDAERVVVRQQPLRLRREDRRDRPRLDETAQRRRDLTVEGVETGEQHRSPAVAEEREGGFDRAAVGRNGRPQGGVGRLRRGVGRLRRGALLGGDVARDFEEDRTASGTHHDPHRALGHGRRVRGVHPSLPLRDRREERPQVELLVRNELEAVDRQLAGERDDRRAIEVRVRDAGHEVGRARPEGRETDARRPGAARHRLGHEGRAGLVPREHELEAGLAETLDEVHHLAARVPEDVPYTRGAQAFPDDASNA